jgi:hypothetical protein
MGLLQLLESFAQSDRSGARCSGKLGELWADFFRRHPHPLWEDKEGDPP